MIGVVSVSQSHSCFCDYGPLISSSPVLPDEEANRHCSSTTSEQNLDINAGELVKI